MVESMLKTEKVPGEGSVLFKLNLGLGIIKKTFFVLNGHAYRVA